MPLTFMMSSGLPLSAIRTLGRCGLLFQFWKVTPYCERAYSLQSFRSSESSVFISLSEIGGEKMPLCKIADICSSYQKQRESTLQSLAGLIREYCNGDYRDCARYQFAQWLGLQYLPKGLQPQQIETIRGVIRTFFVWPFVSNPELGVPKSIPLLHLS